MAARPWIEAQRNSRPRTVMRCILATRNDYTRSGDVGKKSVQSARLRPMENSVRCICAQLWPAQRGDEACVVFNLRLGQYAVRGPPGPVHGSRTSHCKAGGTAGRRLVGLMFGSVANQTASVVRGIAPALRPIGFPQTFLHHRCRLGANIGGKPAQQLSIPEMPVCR
jgi:hypothetical protein